MNIELINNKGIYTAPRATLSLLIDEQKLVQYCETHIECRDRLTIVGCQNHHYFFVWNLETCLKVNKNKNPSKYLDCPCSFRIKYTFSPFRLDIMFSKGWICCYYHNGYLIVEWNKTDLPKNSICKWKYNC